jgi:HAD superfamily hydrolase (TIGR01490 family)
MEKLAIFDLDNTLLKESAYLSMVNFFYKKKLVSKFFYLKAIFWLVFFKLRVIRNPKKIMERAFSFLKNKKESAFRDVLGDFFEEKYMFEQALNILKGHKKNGKKILLVSNSFEQILEIVANLLEIDYFIGTKLEIKNGRFTGKIEGDTMYGENKVLAINKFLEEKGMSLEGSWGYSDHHSDIPLLKMVENPVAVNPDRKLLKVAKKLKWPVLNLTF